MRATTLSTNNPSIKKIKCFFKKKSGLENLAAAKSIVEDVTIIKPINIRLVTHAKKSKSSPLLSKNSMICLILLTSILIACGDKDDDTAVEAEETEVVDTAEEVSEPEDQEGEEEAE